jgi:hypothetical protein
MKQWKDMAIDIDMTKEIVFASTSSGKALSARMPYDMDRAEIFT